MVLGDKAGRYINLKFLVLVDGNGSHLKMKEVHLSRMCAFALQPEDPSKQASFISFFIS